MADRFIDNGNDTITDNELNLIWKKTDSFQDTQKWMNLFKWQYYVESANLERLAGYDSWRYPNHEEAWSLFDLLFNNTDIYGDDIYLPSIFEPGSAGTSWTNEEKDSSALVVQYEDGMKVWPSKYAHLNMAYRMVKELD